MPEDIKLWEILDENRLEEIKKRKLDLEERLEKWLEQDISILSDDLLVIGRQVNTDFGGVIDLLCLNYNGDIYIIELKRDKTPREVTAQTLDYASWVSSISNEKITEIANSYFGEDNALERHFKEKFDKELPDILNENHNMIIIASDIDSSSERIIQYLSQNYGVGINATTFQYFQDIDGRELLARVFLIEPDQVEYRTQTKTKSKRKPPLTYEELQKTAYDKGIGEMYEKLVNELCSILNGKHATRSSIAFVGSMNKSRKTIFSLIPTDSNRDAGLKFQVYINRLSEYLNIDKDGLIRILPQKKNVWIYDVVYDPQSEWAGYEGFFENMDEVKFFIASLNKMIQINYSA